MCERCHNDAVTAALSATGSDPTDHGSLIVRLNVAVKNLTGGDVDFASSLLRQYKSRGHLSDKQWHWVSVLTERGEAAPTPEERLTAAVEAAPSLGGSFAPIITMFNLARSNGLKRVGVRLVDEHGYRLKIYPAGENSVNRGWLYVKGSEYLGKIDPKTGKFLPSRDCRDSVIRALKQFATDPVQAAKGYAIRTSNCSFCGIELSDPRSVEVGYGPICAERYGLPWG
jgi:hypothetical protein